MLASGLASVFGGDDDLARSRRGVLVQLKEDAMQKEQVEARALLQLGREEQAVALRRASARNAKEEEAKQRAAARQCRKRRNKLEQDAWGDASVSRGRRLVE